MICNKCLWESVTKSDTKQTNDSMQKALYLQQDVAS